jgi:hypothetical protein
MLLGIVWGAPGSPRAEDCSWAEWGTLVKVKLELGESVCGFVQLHPILVGLKINRKLIFPVSLSFGSMSMREGQNMWRNTLPCKGPRRTEYKDCWRPSLFALQHNRDLHIDTVFAAGRSERAGGETNYYRRHQAWGFVVWRHPDE